MEPLAANEKAQEEFLRKKLACVEAICHGARSGWLDGDAAVLVLDLGDDTAGEVGAGLLGCGFVDVALRGASPIIVARTLAASFPRLSGMDDAPPGWLPVVALTGGGATLASFSNSTLPGQSGMVAILRSVT